MICLLESNSRSFLEIGEAHTDVISTSMSIPADFILGTGHKKKMLNCDMCTINTIQLHDCSGSYVTSTKSTQGYTDDVCTSHDVIKTFVFTEKAQLFVCTRDVQRHHKIVEIP